MSNETLGEYLLTNDHVETFHEQGFVVCRQFIPLDMVEELRLGYDAATRGEIEAWKNSWAPGKILQLGMPNKHIPGWEGHPYVPRIVAAAKQLLGEDIEYRYDQLIYKPPGNSVELLWHQDAGYGWPGIANARSLTCWLAFTAVTEAMGALHFLPGSHKQGIAKHVDASHRNPIGGALEAEADKSAAVVLEYNPGDITFHHGRTLHYSAGNSTDQPRRGLSTHLWPEPNEYDLVP